MYACASRLLFNAVSAWWAGWTCLQVFFCGLLSDTVSHCMIGGLNMLGDVWHRLLSTLCPLGDFFWVSWYLQGSGQFDWLVHGKLLPAVAWEQPIGLVILSFTLGLMARFSHLFLPPVAFEQLIRSVGLGMTACRAWFSLWKCTHEHL